MTIYYAASVSGFYDSIIHGDAIPTDAVEITADEHAALLAEQSAGKLIAAANGHPIAVAPPALTLPEIHAQLCLQVDQVADAVRLAIAGDPLRVVEYERAAAEALAYKDAGYNGIVPLAVQSWADAKEWSGQQAAEDILAVNTAWNTALYAIRDLRLKGKERVRKAADDVTARTEAESVIAQIRAAVASVGK